MQQIQMRKENLGQVLTSRHVAKIMVDLLLEDVTGGKILDPCIGKNIFFRVLEEATQGEKNSYIKTGIEVDSDIIETDQFWDSKKNTLYRMNFFDYDPSSRFDGIIMNPPYVRQEELVDSITNPKDKIIELLRGKHSEYLDRTQNLYVYFFMKAFDLLKKGGTLVAICYDSWLFTKFGETFKQFLQDNFRIDRVIHFEENAFVSVDVGVTILKMTKVGKNTPRNPIRYFKCKNPSDYDRGRFLEKSSQSINELTIEEGPLKFSEELFVPLKKFSENKIRRGISAKVNGFFLFQDPKFSEMDPIIKDVKKIEGYIIEDKHFEYIINVTGNSMSKDLEDYLDTVKNQILLSGKYKTLKKEIENNGEWYKIRVVQPGMFLFNYYLRNKIKFIFNPDNYYASNNFYVFNSTVNPSLTMAILNSTFTQIAILLKSRPQGSGLRKIQLYEFQEVPVFNPKIINQDHQKRLETLGKQLLRSNMARRNKIIHEIDSILLDVYNTMAGDALLLTDIYDFHRNQIGGKSDKTLV